jgi:hypothetical protein
LLNAVRIALAKFYFTYAIKAVDGISTNGANQGGIMRFWYRSLTNVSVPALATVWAVGTAGAQTTGQADELEEVIVTGIRNSLASAQAIKLGTTSKP